MKPKLAFFDFASCEGCQLQVINLEDELLDLLGNVEIVNFREAMSERNDDYAIAFVEGSITREADIPRLKKIRENAALVIALGACAVTGGLNGLKNLYDLEEVKRMVYHDQAHYFETFSTRPIEAVIPVDYYIRGCPISKKDFLRVTKALLLGKKPEDPNYAVCVECNLLENVCLFDKGMFCLGPITRAGCEAWCPSNNDSCVGCRGLVEDSNTNSEIKVLQEHGLTLEDALAQFKLFNTCVGVPK